MISNEFVPARGAIAFAARLGTSYGFGVFILLSLLVAFTGEWVGMAGTVVIRHVTVFCAFSVAAFLLLAIARRLGYATLWLLTLAVWIAGPLTKWTDLGILVGFVFWSIATLPLYIVGLYGFPRSDERASRRWLRWPIITLTIWSVFLILTLVATPTSNLFLWSAITGSFGHPPQQILDMARVVWGALPFLIALEALARLRNSS